MPKYNVEVPLPIMSVEEFVDALREFAFPHTIIVEVEGKDRREASKGIKESLGEFYATNFGVAFDAETLGKLRMVKESSDG